MEPLTVFAECDTSIVSDAMDAHGLDGVITGIPPAAPTHTAVGRARPVTFERAREGGDEEGPTNFPHAMLDAIAADELFVLSGVSRDLSCWGGQASALAAAASMAGVVIDGGYRDSSDIRDGSFPVFGRGPTPRSGQKRVRIASTTDPVTVDGVRVEPPDIVVADATGIVVVPARHADAVAERAAVIRNEEADLTDKVSAGVAVEEIRDTHEQF